MCGDLEEMSPLSGRWCHTESERHQAGRKRLGESKNLGIGKSVALLKEQVCYFKLFKLTLLCPTRVLSLAALGLCPYGGLSVLNNICIVFCIRLYLDYPIISFSRYKYIIFTSCTANVHSFKT